MITLQLILIILAFACACAGVFNRTWKGRPINWVALSLAFWFLTMILSRS